MGVDVHVLDFLLSACCSPDAKSQAVKLEKTLTLGRQGLHIGKDRERANDIIRRYRPDWSINQIDDGTGYADKLFKLLGATDLKFMDISPFEGADVIHDLNYPVPAEQHLSYDCIFDGGTIEHVLNTQQAFLNVACMLKPGGVFLLVDAANNMLGHGMYQFSPELLWTVFSEKNGFEVLRMQLMETNGSPSAIELKNPRVEGKRIEIGCTRLPTYIMMAARKVADVSVVVGYQSDYEAAWARSERGRS